MTRTIMQRVVSIACLILLTPAITAQSNTARSNDAAELKFVVYLSRHGVRSPTGQSEQYNPYSLAPWPTWNVPPGYLTSHGYELMKLFGAYDRMELAKEGLFSSSGCEDAGKVAFYADSDPRTGKPERRLLRGSFRDANRGCNS